jgi:hypothetical protein
LRELALLLNSFCVAPEGDPQSGFLRGFLFRGSTVQGG